MNVQIAGGSEADLSRITSDQEICGGRPCIRHMRIRVMDILGMVAEGVSFEEILVDYPYLESEDLRAAVTYAANLTDHRMFSAA